MILNQSHQARFLLIRRIHLAGGGGRESERLKKKVIALERENQSLRHELHRVLEILEQHGVHIETTIASEEKKEASAGSESANPSLNEKDVWRLVTKHKSGLLHKST